MLCQGLILSLLVYFSLDLLLCLVGRIAGYVTRMSGDVGGALSDGVPIPIADRNGHLVDFNELPAGKHIREHIVRIYQLSRWTKPGSGTKNDGEETD